MSKNIKLQDVLRRALARADIVLGYRHRCRGRKGTLCKHVEDVVQPIQVVRLNFRNYKLPGDVFSITLNTQTNRLLEMSVTTYMGDPSKRVDMFSQTGTLTDGATYPAGTELQLSSSNIDVDVVNTGYRKLM